MSLNHTLNYLLAKRAEVLIHFSALVTTASTTLKCAGGETGDGLPLPRAGFIIGLDVWDGANHRSDAGAVGFAAGDRLTLYAEHGGTTYTVKARLNGVDTTIAAANVAENATLTATATVMLIQ
ncbi:MAG: hypothetical protein FJY67_01815 [Calditrichaeota bacterium]|nr:hypothetical protein [Calditrichota bacterium]